MPTNSVHESPSARLSERGAAALTDAEMLSMSAQISLGDALSLVDAFGGSLRRVFAACAEDLQRHVTEKQAARIALISQLHDRTIQEKITHKSFVECSKDVFELLHHRFADLTQEVFSVVFLNTKHRVLKIEELSRGTVDSASVYPREVIKRALQLNAASLVIVHNHPSGNPEPSREDQRLTQEMRDAAKLVDVVVLDHIIVGANEYFSFAEKGLM
jgi:DNA repair protein RadC